jgi:hypothetical protein
MRRHGDRTRRRSTWVGFALIALAAVAALSNASAQEAEEDAPRITVYLDQRNDSGIEATAILESSNGTTRVTVTISGTDESIPLHIHEGTCDDLNPVPTYPLTDVTSGEPSMTIVDAMLADLLSRPFAIDAHQPTDNLEALLDPSMVVACGNIVAGLGGDEPMTPTVGVGIAAEAADRPAWLLGGAAIAGALSAVGFWLRRK